MKRLSCILLVCLFLFTICFQTIASAASVDIKGADASYLAAGDYINANSISIWGNYIFASTVDNGLEIIDMEDSSIVATWHLDSTEIIPGLNSFSSVQTVVTDEYIICANTMYVVIFPNEGKYTDTPPELIARITPNPAKAKRTFNQLKRMFVKDGYLYLFDLTAKNEFDGVSGEADMAVMWKMPLNDLEDIEYTYSSLKWAGLEQLGVEYCVIGEFQYFWDTVKIDSKYAYCMTYNDELLLPKKTLFVNTVDLETLEVNSGEILQNKASGLQTQFETAGEITMDEIRDLELYVARVDETEYVPLSSFLDVENTEYLMVDIDYDAENDKSTVKLMFSADVISALVDVFDCSENDVVNNGIVFAVDVDGVQKQFIYVTNDVCYESGIIAIDSSNKNLYVMTGTTTGQNLLIPVSVADITRPKTIGTKLVTPIGSYDIAMDAICVGSYLVALYKGVSSRAAVYDISNPGNIPYNFIKTIELRSGIYLSNTLSSLVYYGNKYYYADTLGKAIGMLETTAKSQFANIFANDGAMPVRLYGYNSEADEVSVVIDGEIEVTVPVYNGVWSYTIAMAENGVHTADVYMDGYSNHFDYTVNVPLPVTVDEAGYTEDDAFYTTITNNTMKYASTLHAENIKAIAVLYDEDENPIMISEQDVTVPYGESLDVVFDILSFDVEDYNGTVKIYMVNQKAPITVAYSYAGGVLSEPESPTVTGKLAGITYDTPEIDANNKLISIGGTVECDGPRPVLMVISVDGFVYDVQETVCDENGRFEFVYSYADDSMSGQSIYNVSVNAMMGGNNSISENITLMDTEVFDAHVEHIENNVTTAQELLEYLEDNKQFSRELGMNLDDSNFAQLKNSKKLEVMGAALAIIKSGDRSTLSETFKSKSAELKNKQDIETAKKDINSAAISSLYGILEKYKDLIGISDSVWNAYKSNKKISTVNRYFIAGGDITDLSQVEDRLKSAMTKANNEKDPGSTKVVGDGIISKYEVPVETIDVTPVDPDLVYDPEEVTFKDLGNVEWAQTAIFDLADKGILTGVTRTEFRPEDKVTREQFVKMLVIALGLEDETAVCTFKDVKSGAWYYKYVAAAEKCGLTGGDGTNFGIGREMTREEMATFAYRAVRIAGITLPEKVEEQVFADNADISGYASDAISAMQKAGVINGVGDNMYAPQGTCTRAMAAKVVYELLNI